MATILVEARRDPNCRPILDALADACEALGHVVRRWRGPISGRVRASRRLVRCDLAILFNGAHNSYLHALRKLRESSTKLLFVELGWYPQLETFQLDPEGINAAASWTKQRVKLPIGAARGVRLPVRDSGDLLVLLQYDDDTQITSHSPWFADMHEFVAHLAQYSELPLTIRPHPRHPLSESSLQSFERRGCRIDRSARLDDALRTCRAIACINSSAAVQALASRLPVLCYGEAIYRHGGAVYRMDGDGDHTRRVTSAILKRECEITEEAIAEMLDCITAQQWRIEQIPTRLPGVLTSLLGRASAIATSRRRLFNLRRAG